MNHLPIEAQIIANNQGWDESSIIISLLGFIESLNRTNDLVQYLADVAEEENRDG